MPAFGCCCVTTCTANPTVSLTGCNVTGATVVLTNPLGTNYTFNSVGSGNYTYITTLSGTAGDTWTYSVSKAGFTTSTGTWTFVCGVSTISVPFVHPGVTISGNVASCSANLAGATVTVGGAWTGSTTTNSSGNYSIFVPVSSGTITLTASKSRLVSWTQNITIFCGTVTLNSGSNGFGLGNFGLDPATGYACAPCCADPLPTTLYASSSLFGTQALTYSTLSGLWEADFDSVDTACTNANCRTANALSLLTCKLRVTTNGCNLVVKAAYCVNLSPGATYVTPTDSSYSGTPTYATSPPAGGSPYFSVTGGSTVCPSSYAYTATINDSGSFSGTCVGYSPRSWSVTVTE